MSRCSSNHEHIHQVGKKIHFHNTEVCLLFFFRVTPLSGRLQQDLQAELGPNTGEGWQLKQLRFLWRRAYGHQELDKPPPV